MPAHVQSLARSRRENDSDAPVLGLIVVDDERGARRAIVRVMSRERAPTRRIEAQAEAQRLLVALRVYLYLDLALRANACSCQSQRARFGEGMSDGVRSEREQRVAEQQSLEI